MIHWHIVLTTGLAANGGVFGKHSWELTVGEFSARDLMVG